jgi:hypothetical protein
MNPGTVVLRQQVFSLLDGTFVVQHEPQRVQELFSSRYRLYDPQRDYGHAITDYELQQLYLAGWVSYFDETTITLEIADTEYLLRGKRHRLYYLNTTLPEALLQPIQHLLEQVGLQERYLARQQRGFVVILGRDGKPFANIEDSQKAQQQLQALAPRFLTRLTPSFVEAEAPSLPFDETEPLTPEWLQGFYRSDSEGDTSVTHGKSVVLAVRQDEERQAIATLLQEMGMNIHHALSGKDVVMLMEDHECDGLVTDFQLSDMHIWTMLGTLKESVNLKNVPIVVLMDNPTVLPVFSVTSVIRPFSIVTLRSSIWDAFKKRG